MFKITKTKLIRSTVVIIVLALPLLAIAKSGYIKVPGGSSIQSVLRKDLGVPSWLIRKKKFIADVRRNNPHIKNFRNLKKGQILKVRLPNGIRLNPRSKTPLKLVKNKSDLERPKRRAKKRSKYSKERRRKELLRRRALRRKRLAARRKKAKTPPTKWSLSAFYSLSKGTYVEDLKQGNASATSTQDSPATLGLAAFKKINTTLSYSGSFYLSMLDAGEFDTGETVSIPPEIGLTSYIGYQGENWPVEIYAGLDQERISSFNTDELSSGESLSTREHNLTYLTFGVGKFFKAFNRNCLLKASLSNTILSTQSRPSLIDESPFTGYKFILYMNTKLTDRWLAHVLYKEHHLDGATELDGNRLGFGVGYKFH